MSVLLLTTILLCVCQYVWNGESVVPDTMCVVLLYEYMSYEVCELKMFIYVDVSVYH